LSTVPNNKYGELSGTSMAAPHVSGLAAVIASKFPEVTHLGIRNLIIAGGQKKANFLETMSGRRIRGADEGGVGSLSCLNQIINVRQEPVLPEYQIQIGQSLFLSAFHINCASGAGPITLWRGDDGNVVLHDEGEHGDDLPQDGIYSLNWTPHQVGIYQLRFSDEDTVKVTVSDASPSLTATKLKTKVSK
jgi:subtilisin family serine protease